MKNFYLYIKVIKVLFIIFLIFLSRDLYNFGHDILSLVALVLGLITILSIKNN